MCKIFHISNNAYITIDRDFGSKKSNEEKEIYQIDLQLWILKKLMIIKIMD